MKTIRERLQSGYAKLGITIVGSGAMLILLYQLMINRQDVMQNIGTLREILSPFIYGFLMAYLLCPVYNLVVRNTYKLLENRFKKKKYAFIFARIVGTTLSILLLCGVVAGFFALVIPELMRSIFGLLELMPERMTELLDWIKVTFTGEHYPEMSQIIEKSLIQTRDALVVWTQQEFLPKIGVYMSQLSQGIILTVRTLLHILIGVVICVYVLNGKDNFRAQIKKFITATMNHEKSDAVFEFAYYTNKTFGGFINGKLIDSLIMGVLCFIVMTILHLPYVMLVSTIVGVTNFIPFFGPFIGAIPSAIIIFLVSPVQAIYFMLMILVLQQIDGNIIGPKILGETTGLASFWVMFSIIVGGGLFGFAGMVLGVPVFSLFYYYFKKTIEKKLQFKNRPVDTKAYEDFNVYDINRKDVQ